MKEARDRILAALELLEQARARLELPGRDPATKWALIGVSTQLMQIAGFLAGLAGQDMARKN